MPSKDIYSNSRVLTAFTYRLITAASTFVGTIIDCAGWESVLFIAATANVLGPQGYFFIQEGDESDLSDAATATNVQGGATIDDAGDDNAAFRMAYRGGKRYVRLCFVGDGSASGQYGMGYVVLLNPASGPTAAQST